MWKPANRKRGGGVSIKLTFYALKLLDKEALRKAYCRIEFDEGRTDAPNKPVHAETPYSRFAGNSARNMKDPRRFG